MVLVILIPEKILAQYNFSKPVYNWSSKMKQCLRSPFKNKYLKKMGKQLNNTIYPGKRKENFKREVCNLWGCRSSGNRTRNHAKQNRVRGLFCGRGNQY